MDPKVSEITINDLYPMTKKIGVNNPHTLPTNELLGIINKHQHRQHNKRKSLRIHKGFRDLGLNKLAKRQNLTRKDLREAIRLNNKSVEDLRKLAKLRRIKNYDGLTKEDLIYILLRSEKSLQENKYEKYIIKDTDNEISATINTIRILISQLENVLTKEQRKTIREELHEIEKKTLTKAQKERTLAYIIELVVTLSKQEKYQYSDHHDLDYFGVRDIEIYLIMLMITTNLY